MNFFAGAIEGDVIHTPMGAVPLVDALRRSLECALRAAART